VAEFVKGLRDLRLETKSIRLLLTGRIVALPPSLLLSPLFCRVSSFHSRIGLV